MKTLNKKTTLTDWVTALRSGKYKQQQGTLKGEEGYCCLGVFCSINGKEPEVSPFLYDEKGEQMIDDLDEGDKELYSFCKKLIGDPFLYAAAIEMNDEGKSFERIADYIEREASVIKREARATV